MAMREGRVRVTPEHQLVISAKQLEEAGISPGDELFITCDGGCINLTKLGPLNAASGKTVSARSNGNGNGNGHGRLDGVQYRY